MTDHFLKIWLNATAQHKGSAWESVEHGWEQHVLVDHTNNIVYRYPRNQNASNKLADEVSVLSALNQVRFNVAIPRILEHKKAKTSYEYIPGDIISEDKTRSLTNDQAEKIGQDLGEFLAILHSVNPVVANSKKTKQSISLYDYYLDRIENAKDELFYEHVINLAKKIKPQKPYVVMHGDLHGLNMIIDPLTNRLTGVIDFSELELGDRHQDFRKIFMTDERFIDPALKVYKKLSGYELSKTQITAWAYINEWANIAFYKDKTSHPTYRRALKHLKSWGEISD